jgi:hypothetical protein
MHRPARRRDQARRLSVLDKERQFYRLNVESWARDHPGKFVVVKDKEVVGFFGSHDEALTAGAARFGLTSFLVREVGHGEATVTVPALALGLLGADPPRRSTQRRSLDAECR